MKYRVYNLELTPFENLDNSEYYNASTQKDAIKLYEKLNKLEPKKNWVWA